MAFSLILKTTSKRTMAWEERRQGSWSNFEITGGKTHENQSNIQYYKPELIFYRPIGDRSRKIYSAIRRKTGRHLFTMSFVPIDKYSFLDLFHFVQQLFAPYGVDIYEQFRPCGWEGPFEPQAVGPFRLKRTGCHIQCSRNWRVKANRVSTYSTLPLFESYHRIILLLQEREREIFILQEREREREREREIENFILQERERGSMCTSIYRAGTESDRSV